MTIPERGRRARRRVGLALAGGGPVGAMYEIGALRALEEAVEGLDLTAAWSYVGVSAGSFIAACLANGLTTAQMLRAIVRDEPGVNPFQPEVFFTPAYREFARRGLMLPRLAVTALVAFGRRPGNQGLGEAIGHLAHALPTGIFDNEPIRRYLAEIFALDGRTDDFRRLPRRLTVVAADLDAGTAIRFGRGSGASADVPISRAVQASTALPGVYPPVRIGGRACVDGVLLKTVHASVALEEGAELLFCINPIVPIDAADAARRGRLPHDVLTDSGLPAVLSQTFRTLIHSRLRIGVAGYATRFPDADVVLIEPSADEYGLFFSNIFSFRDRRQVCEAAYAATRRELLARRAELEPTLARHGLGLRADVLADPARDLWTGAGVAVDPDPRAPGRLGHALGRLETVLAGRAAR